MKAITIAKDSKDGARLQEVDKPQYNDNEVLVKVKEAGVCRTDLEINEGFYGELPPGSDYLIMGHESIGIVEEAGKNVQDLKVGDYVTRTVRRPCLENTCENCPSELDFCSTGKYTETGIKGLHGIMTEYYADQPKYLVKVPKEFANVGVLMEPLSFAEKAVTQSYLVQKKRMRWWPQKALVFGAGPIGLLETMILRSRGLDVDVVARSRTGFKSYLAENIGAKYISIQDIETLGKYDLVIESSGSPQCIELALNCTKPNGVVCLTSVTSGSGMTVIPLEKINLDMVLGNRTIIGAVNASINDYKMGLDDIVRFERNWPGVLGHLITQRLKPNQYKAAFEHRKEDIKTVIEF